MVEIYDLAGTRSFGNYAHIKSAWGQLDYLREMGHLGKIIPAVRVSCFIGKTLKRVYRAEYAGRWKLIEEWTATSKNTQAKDTAQNKQEPIAPRKLTRRERNNLPDLGGVFAAAQELAKHNGQLFGVLSRNF